MEFDDIQHAHGKIERRTCLRKLTNLGNDLFDADKWRFVDEYDSQTDVPDIKGRYYVTVGNKALAEDCNDNEWNKAAYVLAVKDMYHEQRHTWQYTKAWNDKTGLSFIRSYQQTSNMVRRKFVSSYFPSTYFNNYSNDPSEIDAEKYGIKKALTYFKSDPIISKQEAEEILFELTMSDSCIYKEMLEPYKDKLNTIHDVLNVFEEKAKTTAFVKYPVTDKIESRFTKEVSEEDLIMTRKYLSSYAFEDYRQAFSECNNGIEQDKVLEQVILVADRKSFKRAPARLHDELIECKQQMERDMSETGPHAISPKRISYSIELTEEDVAAIPTDSNSIKL